MAVFPDRIVLKNSTDDQATIEAAIESGGTDEIIQGEIVLGINPTSVQLYTKAGDGSIVTLGGAGASTLGDLTDVDLSTPATDGQVIAYNSTSGNWEPVNQSGGGGGGGGSGAGIYLTETETSTAGEATFTGLGYSGILQKVTSTVDAWIVLYTSAAERTADASRSFNTDPATGSGVLAEFYITAGATVLATPGTTYLNNDATLTEAIYAAVRTQAGAAVVADVTISAYGLAAITAVSGGTFGSGV